VFKDLVLLARPHQYTKNLFVFLPAFFAFQLNTTTVWISGIKAFFAFSLIASSVYTLNDWMDRTEDRKHPEKKNRPLADGRISSSIAFVFMSTLFVAGSLVGLSISMEIFSLLLFYVIINIAYSVSLKHIVLIDITIISIGFLIRLLVGAEATATELSLWIIVLTFLLALFLALAKRRDEVILYLDTENKTRKVIEGYNVMFLTMAMGMVASIIIVIYILWSISPEVTDRLRSNNLYLSAIFVLLGLLRYLQITIVEEKSGKPSEILLNDRFIQFTLLGWMGICTWMLYIS
jgi:4-hydroxybenzoate polyprenyltransferase